MRYFPALKTNPQVFDVRDYGAIGTLDDAPAYNAAIAAMPATGGILHIIGDRPNFESSVVLNKPIKFIGAGRTDSSGQYGPTIIRTSNPTCTPIRVQSSACTLEDFGMAHSSSNVLAGAGILCDVYQPRAATFNVPGEYAGGSFDINRVTVFGHNNGIHVRNGIEYTITNFHIEASKINGLWLEHKLLEDGGDQAISNGNIIADKYNGSTGILATSGGGIKIVNTKFNGRTGAYGFDYSVDVNIANSVDFLLSNCSIENARKSCVKVRPSSLMSMVVITGNQFAAQCQQPTIDVEGIRNFTIGHNVINQILCSSYAVSVRNCKSGGYVARQTLRFADDSYVPTIANATQAMQRVNSPSVPFEDVAGGADFAG